MDDKEQAAIDALRAAGLEAEACAVESLRARHTTTMDAFHAAQRASYKSGQAAERDRLRASQAEAVMPLIGPLLDAWECCSQSVREDHPELDKHLRRINRAMEEAGEGPNDGVERSAEGGPLA